MLVSLSIPDLGLESVCPWPRIFFVFLASSLVSSTPPLVAFLCFRSYILQDKNKLKCTTKLRSENFWKL